MPMQSGSRLFFRGLSLLVVGTIFLCQVIGSLCPMAVPGLDTTVMIHQAHAEHTVGTSSMCQASLPSSSSPKSFEATVLLLLPVLDSSCCVVTQASLRSDVPSNVLPLRSGPPLYIHLSTFRI
jgi:hypothetical protein